MKIKKQNTQSRSGAYWTLPLIWSLSILLLGCRGSTEKITGIVESETDAHGMVTGVVIAVQPENAGDEEEVRYSVVNSGEGNELRQWIGESVQVTGVIKVNESGQKTIQVTHFKSLPEEPDNTSN